MLFRPCLVRNAKLNGWVLAVNEVFSAKRPLFLEVLKFPIKFKKYEVKGPSETVHILSAWQFTMQK